MLVSLTPPRSMLAVRSTPSLLLSRPGFEFALMPMSLANVGLSAQPVAYRDVSAGMAGGTAARRKGLQQVQALFIGFILRPVNAEPEIERLRRIPLQLSANRDFVLVSERLSGDPIALPCAALFRGHRRACPSSPRQCCRTRTLRALSSLCEPYSSENPACGSAVGRLLMKLISPPVVLRPYKVPWGPRKTSTRSMSNSWPCVWIGRANATPSRLTPTGEVLFEV